MWTLTHTPPCRRRIAPEQHWRVQVNQPSCRRRHQGHRRTGLPWLYEMHRCLPQTSSRVDKQPFRHLLTGCQPICTAGGKLEGVSATAAWAFCGGREIVCRSQQTMPRWRLHRVRRHREPDGRAKWLVPPPSRPCQFDGRNANSKWGGGVPTQVTNVRWQAVCRTAGYLPCSGDLSK